MGDFKRTIAIVLSAAMVIGGMTMPENVKGSNNYIEDVNWSFFQSGQYHENPIEEEAEAYNNGYINSVIMNGSNELINGWLRGEEGNLQEQKALQTSDGFTIDIENTGWDCFYETETGYGMDRINPWSIQAKAVAAMSPYHEYKVSFKAKASENKLAYVEFNTDSCGEKISFDDSYGLKMSSDSQLIKIDTQERTYEYYLTNWVSGLNLETVIMLGAFNSQYDFEGNAVVDIITERETAWNGSVTISDFTIEDCGTVIFPVTTTENQSEANIDTTTLTTSTTISTTSASMITQSETEQAQKVIIKKATIKSVKRNKVKKLIKGIISKIAYAKGYQIKYSVRKKMIPAVSKESKKLKFTIKRVKNKKYYIKVRAYTIVNGKRIYGKWSKKITV